ncbi:NAD-dependent deacylase [Nesterenkonia sp. NBAIMH1]|uniref:SIR2 family NAD-dependent protein deacylase n=1 Tax=Nesterenkonia sp. NBAIMH1 TaxID=2600320 RepID=UPI0011B791C5|nr:NAD-dependent deacylase [Nesterenkonia sp. NBAIMH1]
MSAAHPPDRIPDDVVQLVAQARRPVVLTGAGISAESGVPTFREVQTGLWERFSAQDLASVEAFEADPALVWTWYRWRQSLIRAVEPNPGHIAIAEWQQLPGVGLTLSTQNVDDLHERAGASVLAHLHGSIFAHRCFSCDEPVELPDADYDGFQSPPAAQPPPTCGACDGPVRPGVVWFGEMLPTEAFEQTAAAVRAADLVLVAGTSGIVQPAASLPLLALERGTPLIEVNPEETELSELMDHCVRGPSGEVLPKLLRG